MDLDFFDGPEPEHVETDDFIRLLASQEKRRKCNLNLSPKHNWVEDSGGLPEYIHSIACALVSSGHSVSSAIQIAISRCKVWCAGGGNVNADTKAKACAAIAAWESKKAKAKAKRNADMKIETREGAAFGVRPEGDPDKRLFAARVLNYGPVDDHGTSWAPGVFAESLRSKKPPAVWSHQANRPIGKVVDYRDSSEGLDVIVQLADFEAVPDARMAHALLRDEIIDQFSFGFQRQDEEPDPSQRGAVRITKATMLEVSPVLVASGKGTRTLAVRSTTRAQATELLNQVANGELDPQTALEQLAELQEPEFRAFEEIETPCCGGIEDSLEPDADLARELRELDDTMREWS